MRDGYDGSAVYGTFTYSTCEAILDGEEILSEIEVMGMPETGAVRSRHQAYEH